MSLTKITDSVVETFSRWFRVNSTTGAITSVIPDLSGSNTTLYPSFVCRAWVNFDGTKDTTGTSSTSNTNRLIRGSGNVASVLRNGTGDYTITFTTAMPDINYTIIGLAGTPSAAKMTVDINVDPPSFTDSPPALGSFRISTNNYASTDTDAKYVNLTVFR
jgi:hypothetical protein